MLFLAVSSVEAGHLKLYTYDLPDLGQTVATYNFDYIQGPEGDRSGGNPFMHEIEIEHSFTKWWCQSLYFDYAYLAGEVNELNALKTEFNFAFFEKGQYFVDFRLNIELALAINNQMDMYGGGNAADTIEFRPIFEKNFERFSIVIGPIIVKELSAPGGTPLAGPTLGYANAIMFGLTDRVGFNLEFHGSLGEARDMRFMNRQGHYLLPNLDIAVTRNINFSLGTAFGLTGVSDDFTLRAALQYGF
ncbi:MAG: hypothetical protein HZA01_07125 [Nitrospinae bacterium]|nr:hypothetical protein [Nitrospinota bacterium]